MNCKKKKEYLSSIKFSNKIYDKCTAYIIKAILYFVVFNLNLFRVSGIRYASNIVHYIVKITIKYGVSSISQRYTTDPYVQKTKYHRSLNQDEQYYLAVNKLRNTCRYDYDATLSTITSNQSSHHLLYTVLLHMLMGFHNIVFILH